MSTQEQINEFYKNTDSYKQQVPYEFALTDENKLVMYQAKMYNGYLGYDLDRLYHFQLAYTERTKNPLPSFYMEALLPALDVEHVLYTDDYKIYYDYDQNSNITAKIYKQVDDILDICEPTRYTPEKLAIICDLYNKSDKQVPLTEIYAKFHPDFSDDKYLSVVKKINKIFTDTKEVFHEKEELEAKKERLKNSIKIYECCTEVDKGMSEYVEQGKTKYNLVEKAYNKCCREYRETMRIRIDGIRNYNEHDKLVKSK